MNEISIARIVDDTWQTPVYRYRHPRTGRQATIVGTALLGTPGYYRILAEQVRSRAVQGALAYGGAGPYGIDDGASATVDEQAVLDLIAHLDTLEHQLATRLGWARQIDTLTADGWRTFDVPQVEMIRACGVHQVHAALRQRQVALGDPALPDSCTRMREIVGVQARSLAIPGQHRGPLDSLLIDARTAMVRDAVAATMSDVVLVYEANHVPALDKVIRSLGMARANRVWIPALPLPPLPHLGPLTTRTTEAWRFPPEASRPTAVTS
jgi:hypothetical protein